MHMRTERMRMMQAAELLIEETDRVRRLIRGVARRQADHLERSADSVLFNMSEGVASFRPRVKINAYEIARKEANEVRSILRRLVLRRAIAEPDVVLASELAGACIAMLTAAIIAVENRLD